MVNIKTKKILFWITTILIVIMEGLIPAFTSQTVVAKQGLEHLQYPQYFGNALVVFKILGALVLIIPQVPKRLKEWAYAGFAFDFIFASISYFAVDGMTMQSFFPLIFLIILIVSYYFYYKLNGETITNKI